jgi:hypothetical protein
MELEEVQIQLLGWYWKLQNEEGCGNLYRIESLTASACSPLEDEPYLRGTFSGSVNFSDEYHFELMMIYWFGCIMLYTSIARVHKLLYPGVLQGILRLADEPENMTGENYDARREIERTANLFATRVCQTIAFCERSNAGPSRFQITLPGLWAAQQFYRGRCDRKFRWCQMISNALQKKGLMFGSITASVSQQEYVERSERLHLNKA